MSTTLHATHLCRRRRRFTLLGAWPCSQARRRADAAHAHQTHTSSARLIARVTRPWSSGSSSACWAAASKGSARCSCCSACPIARRCRTSSAPAGRPRPRALRRRQRLLPLRGRRGPQRRRRQRGVGRALPREAQQAGSVAVVRGGAQAESPRSGRRTGHGAHVADDNPPMASRSPSRRCGQSQRRRRPRAAGGVSLDDRKRPDATTDIDKALTINPNHLEARRPRGRSPGSRRARRLEAAIAAVLKINPLYGEVHRDRRRVAARSTASTRPRFLREAVALDPDNCRRLADLGLHLLRTGDEAEARKALDTAVPRRSVRHGHLQPVEPAGHARQVRDDPRGDLVDPAARRGGGHAPYLRPLAEEALAELSKRWNFTPTGPILVEVFPRHDDFAVRTMGLPGMIGALGACFGRVVTMDSPKARPPGDLQLGATLWHELAHVITLQMSGNQRCRAGSPRASRCSRRRAPARTGAARWRSLRQARMGGGAAAADLNRGFSNPRDHHAGVLGGVGAGRAPRGDASASRRCAQLVRVVRRGPRHRRGDPAGAEGADSTTCRRPSTATSRAVRGAARGARRARGLDRDCRSRAADLCRPPTPAASASRWCSARRSRPGDLDGRAAARARGQAGARLPRARPAPGALVTRRSGRSDKAAREPGADARSTTTPPRSRAAAGRAARGPEDAAARAAALPAWSRSIRSMPPPTPPSAAWRSPRRRARGARALQARSMPGLRTRPALTSTGRGAREEASATRPSGT